MYTLTLYMKGCFIQMENAVEEKYQDIKSSSSCVLMDVHLSSCTCDVCVLLIFSHVYIGPTI